MACVSVINGSLRQHAGSKDAEITNHQRALGYVISNPGLRTISHQRQADGNSSHGAHNYR